MKKFVLIVLLTILPLLLSSYIMILSPSFFDKAFSQYGVSEMYSDVSFFHSGVMDYIVDRNEEMPLSIYLNERELTHMEDVKEGFFYFNLVFLLVLAGSVLLLLLISKREIGRVFLYGGIFSLELGVLLLLSFGLNFNGANDVFHSLFFTGDSWLFEVSDNIVNIYPQGLFFDLFKGIFLMTVWVSVGFVGIGVVLRNKRFMKRFK